MRIRHRNRVRLAVLFSLSLLSAVPAANAQAPAQTADTQAIGALGQESQQNRQWRVGGFVGAAHNSPVTPALGVTPGRDHLFIGLQAQTTILNVRALRLSYGAQIVPALIVRGRTAPLGYRYIRGTDEDGTIAGPNHAYAFGFSPFSLEVAAPLGNRVGVYAASTAGLLIFTRPFPVPEAQQANFTLEYGAGVLVRTGRRQWIQLGYKYHHLSNAFYSIVNPGLDANVFYVGYWRAIGR